MGQTPANAYNLEIWLYSNLATMRGRGGERGGGWRKPLDGSGHILQVVVAAEAERKGREKGSCAGITSGLTTKIVQRSAVRLTAVSVTDPYFDSFCNPQLALHTAKDDRIE